MMRHYAKILSWILLLERGVSSIKQIRLLCGIGLFCLFLSPAVIYGEQVVYRLGINEEMPSNHVYHMLVDRHGYLWVATSHSVIRYNGYETKVFDISAGLPSNEVWGLHEDARGRIWVLCFCHALGYIFNDEFHPVALEDPPPRLYPRIWDAGDQILLYNQQDGASAGLLYFEAGAEMPGVLLDDLYWVYYDSGNQELLYIVRDKAQDQEHLRFYKAKLAPGRIVRKKLAAGISYAPDRRESFTFDKYYMYMKAGEHDKLHVFNMVDAFFGTIHLADSTSPGSQVFNRNRDMFWLYSGAWLYEFDKSLVQTYAIPVPRPVRSLPVTSVLYDDLWGSCFGTAGAGVYIADNMECSIVSPAFQLPHGYRYVGRTGGHTSFWWNQWAKRLLRMDSAGKVAAVPYPSVTAVMKIVPWTPSLSLVLDINSLHLLDHQTGRGQPFAQGKQLDPRNPPEINESLTKSAGLRNLDLVAGDTGEFFLLTRSGVYRFYEEADTIRVRLIEPADKGRRNESYVNLTYDPFRKALWAYNNSTVMKFHEGQALVYKNESQVAPAVRNVEQILVDKRYGTLFLKEFDRIRVHDVHGQRFKTVHPGINLQKTVACIEDDILVVAGKFGITITRILGYGRLSSPIVYQHIKNLQYSDVYDVQIVGAEVIIATDRGLLSVPVPDSTAFSHKHTGVPAKDYKVLLGYKGLPRTIGTGDTLHVDQADMKLRFDVVRPSGSGVLRCSYLLAGLNEKWNPLAGKELLLPPLKPGSTTRMKIRFSDDVWISDPVTVDLYVIPYWWQTVVAQRVLWSGAVLGLLGLIAASVWITRRIVVSKNQRRNAHMEIELKALAVSLRNVPDCTDTSSPVTVTVYDLPEADIIQDGGHLHAAPGFTSYQWYINAHPAPGATDSVFTPVQTGAYRVAVTDSNHCTGMSDPVYIDKLEIPAVYAAQNIKIYPNPVTGGGILFIETEMDVRVTLSSMDGKTLLERQNTTTVDMGRYAAGVYLLRISDRNGVVVRTERILKHTSDR